MDPKDIAKLITEDPDVILEYAAKYTREQINKVLELVRGGMSLAHAAKAIGAHPTSIRTKLDRMGELDKLRSEFGSLSSGERNYRYKEIDTKRIFDMINSGMNVLQIAKATGISRDLIVARINSAPEPLRSELKALLSKALEKHHQEQSEVMKSGKSQRMSEKHPAKNFWAWLATKDVDKRIDIIVAMFGKFGSDDELTTDQKEAKFRMIKKAINL